MVVIGVALEAFDLIEKIRNRNKSILLKESICLLLVESFSISLVVLGLWLEIFATNKSSGFARIKSDGLTSELEVAMDRIGLQSTNIAQLRQLNGTLTKQIDATQTQLTNAEARLIELQEANEPMDIGEQMSLARELSKIPNIHAIVSCANDLKAEKTADNLSSVFVLADWQTSRPIIEPNLNLEGIMISCDEEDGASRTAAHLLLKILTARNVPSKMSDATYTDLTNAIGVVIGERPKPLYGKIMMTKAKEDDFRQQERPLSDRLSDLGRKWYLNQKFSASESEEYRTVKIKFENLENSVRLLENQIEELWEQMGEKDEGTNPPAKGVSIYNSHFNGPRGAFVFPK